MKSKRMIKAIMELTSGVATITITAIASGLALKKNKEALVKVTEGSTQIFNIIINTFQKW